MDAFDGLVRAGEGIGTREDFEYTKCEAKSRGIYRGFAKRFYRGKLGKEPKLKHFIMLTDGSELGFYIRE